MRPRILLFALCSSLFLSLSLTAQRGVGPAGAAAPAHPAIGNREAIAGTAAIALAFTGVLFLVSDLVFSVPVAIAVALAFFALTAWRWWVIALVRNAQD